MTGVKKYPREMREQVYENSNLVYSELGGGFYAVVKNRVRDSYNEVVTAQEVAGAFNHGTRVSIMLSNGDVISNVNVVCRSKQRENLARAAMRRRNPGNFSFG